MFLEIEKIKQASVYLSNRIPNLYTTKFLKLFYYFDFISVLERGTPVTNDVYYHLPYGPIPSFIKDQLSLLKADWQVINSQLMDDENQLQSVLLNSVEMEEKASNQYIVKTKIGKEESLNYLSSYEKELLDDLVEEFAETTTKEIVDKTHNEVPYEQTPENNIIDYKLAFHLDVTKILPKRKYNSDIELSQAEFFNSR